MLTGFLTVPPEQGHLRAETGDERVVFGNRFLFVQRALCEVKVEDEDIDEICSQLGGRTGMFSFDLRDGNHMVSVHPNYFEWNILQLNLRGRPPSRATTRLDVKPMWVLVECSGPLRFLWNRGG